MLSIRKILFPTDYSACAEQAFSQAAYLAERYGAALHVLHVVESDESFLNVPLTEQDIATDLRLPVLEDHLATTSDSQILLNVEVSPVEGSVAQAILTYARTQDMDLIVMGTHGRRGVNRVLLGSVADRVVRLAECPVYTVGMTTTPRRKGAIRRILVPIDFSEHARLTVPYALDLAATYEAHLDVLHVVESTAMPTIYGMEPMVVSMPDVEKPVRDSLHQMIGDNPNVSVAIHVHAGHPVYDIVAFAEQQETDLIVLATHGLTGFKRLFLGSVAEGVIHRAPCPVFTVKGFGKRLLSASVPHHKQLVEIP